MRHAFLDCFSGISGDMFLGALIDAGWPEGELTSLPKKLGLENTAVEVQETKRKGIRGIKVEVSGPGPHPFRNLRDVEAILEKSDLRPEIIRLSLKVFNLLAQVEAKVHGCLLEEVHFHEIGAVDTLVDILGTISGLNYFSVGKIYCSPIPVIRGWIDCEHGRLPLPAPASAELLKNVPTYGVDGEWELVTPTGGALIKVLADHFSTFPEMKVEKIGYGAGSKDIPQWPNLLRIWLGEAQPSEKGWVIVELRSYIDDMNPEWYEYLIERLFGAGALDVVMCPIHMKKNRPGVEITVLATPGHEHSLSQILFEESTTSGIRMNRCPRYILPRRNGMVPTNWGNVRAKLITRPGGRSTISPEYEACKKLARRFNVPLGTVYQAVSQISVENFVDEEGSVGSKNSGGHS
ncbi:MAG: nickel pincer cofactor biosynthesis protein LarC [Deltaproteobacteria bacterium]|nr:nickel pincer cofactor biosynthesis protein LarC [Deltaproteobacteria bacterium]MBW1717954.1 nickel pincer cofactor biosynthesis protein LarC [Deltaproteobacteria bacterium]MBW1931553.1 nickel pincer cofactor biosynthesis protein LarC [Deltaproteobacteria bacterium]MBW1937416.1 nickel pincer cofactor biosynthesis protein LarC [Deltaproteobacteria bacterium]MBW1964290.1 nickel pincer cofactor biosynthesis protein LarC [Deltaproteobacteria bacterium]